MIENEEHKEEEKHPYKVYEMISTLFAIAFTAGLFIKFLFF